MKRNFGLVVLITVIASILLLNGLFDKVGTFTTGADYKDINAKGNLILVNKSHPLPEDYVPDDLVKVNVKFNKTATDEEKMMRKEAAFALEKMFMAAERDKIELYGVNGYRSYDTQKQLYDDDSRTKGYSYSEQYDAKPGTSEHQTGLAMDVTNSRYSTNFGETVEGKWLKNNCYKYGFIIRYPIGMENITGYAYEPWHVRYVGVKAAEDIHSRGIVLEQYLNQ